MTGTVSTGTALTGTALTRTALIRRRIVDHGRLSASLCPAFPSA
ncbi:hypothetical protein ABZ780_23085 [Micromonospora sp. NPDC047467]